MRAVLMYHSLDDSDSAVSLRPEAFERHLDWIVANDVNSTTLSKFPLTDVNENTLALTFDDAFKNFGDEAWPRLKERNLNATVFVVSGRAGKTNRWENDTSKGIPELPLLDWDALGKLAEDGCELGCHTRSHQMLTSLSTTEVSDEIQSCLDTIETRTGSRPTTLAYPYGDCDSKVKKVAASHVERACTTEFALVEGNPNAWDIPRIDAWYFAKQGVLEDFGTSRFASFVRRRRFLRGLRRALPIFRGYGMV